MKKHFLLLICFLIFSIAAWAQSNMEDVVYLKNGSVIRGVIIEQVPNVSIKMRSGENLFFYKMDEVEKMTKEEGKKTISDISSEFELVDFGFKQKGFVMNYEMGMTVKEYVMLSMRLVHGYMINPHFSLGFGVGGELTSEGIYNAPAFLDMRVYLLKMKATPFINLAAGYNFQYRTKRDYWEEEIQSTSHGYMVNPAVGLRIAITQKFGFTTSVGYQFSAQNVTQYGWDYNLQRSISRKEWVNSNGFNLLFGLTF